MAEHSKLFQDLQMFPAIATMKADAVKANKSGKLKKSRSSERNILSISCVKPIECVAFPHECISHPFTSAIVSVDIVILVS